MNEFRFLSFRSLERRPPARSVASKDCIEVSIKAIAIAMSNNFAYKRPILPALLME
jgi:hypothetical protein